MKKITFFILVLFSFRFVSVGQTTCNLSVYIDSIVVKPCFLTGGGACGCGNTLWAVVTGGTAPYSYLWTPSAMTTDTLHGACYLEFRVRVTDANGCVVSDSINVVMPPTGPSSSGIAENGSNPVFNLYPVPAGNELNVSIKDASIKTHTVEVYDVLGKKVISQKINSATEILTLDISSLTEGPYFVRLTGLNGQTTSKFFKGR